MNFAVAAPDGASAFPLASVSPIVTVYVPGCFGTATSMLTFCVWFGRRAGSVCGWAELVSSWPWLLRSSQMRPIEPGPLAVHARVPTFVIGTMTRDCVPTSAAIAFLAPWYRAVADGARCRPVVLALVKRDVEVADPSLLERHVDVRSAQDVPERQRRAVVGDRDHRLERLVQREPRARLLERAVGGDVLWLDDDLVVVVELACVDAALGFGQDAELVERGRDHLRSEEHTSELQSLRH